MNNTGTVLLIVAVVAVAALAIVAFGFAGLTSTTIEERASPPIAVPQNEFEAVVFDLRTEPGMSLLGLQLRSDRHKAHVMMVVPDECVTEDGDDGEVLVSDGICAGLPVHGELSGGGTTETGARLAIVQIEVSQRCYETLRLGEAWSPAVGEC